MTAIPRSVLRLVRIIFVVWFLYWLVTSLDAAWFDAGRSTPERVWATIVLALSVVLILAVVILISRWLNMAFGSRSRL